MLAVVLDDASLIRRELAMLARQLPDASHVIVLDSETGREVMREALKPPTIEPIALPPKLGYANRHDRRAAKAQNRRSRAR